MRKHKIATGFLMIAAIFLSCGDYNFSGSGKYKYKGDINPAKYAWLKGRKVYIDPERNVIRGTDAFCNEKNLGVSMILGDMLERAGAIVAYSRVRDKDVRLKEKLGNINKIRPDLLVILRSGFSIEKEKASGGNSPSVLVWGNRKANPLSYDFAEILLDEFRGIAAEELLPPREYKETGASLLRETRNLCPGVICEIGFFPDERYYEGLLDMEYVQEKSEACFLAVSRFFERGIPEAQVLVSAYVDNSLLTNLIKDKNPVIALKLESGLEKAGIIPGSLSAYLDDIPVKCRAVSNDHYFVDYGKVLYPGVHTIRFSFKNQRNQSSMVLRAELSVETAKGDFEKLVSDGERLLVNRINIREGLKMLLSALSMGHPDADKIIFHIAAGFELLGDRTNAGYYYSKLYSFYPKSEYVKKIRREYKRDSFLQRDYEGKLIEIRYEPSIEDLSKK